jgi:hypothetical protein
MMKWEKPMLQPLPPVEAEAVVHRFFHASRGIGRPAKTLYNKHVCPFLMLAWYRFRRQHAKGYAFER